MKGLILPPPNSFVFNDPMAGYAYAYYPKILLCSQMEALGFYLEPLRESGGDIQPKVWFKR